MTKEILTFNSIEEANKEKKNRAKTWRPLHTDFVNNKIRVTFVNGLDDPDNSPESIKNKEQHVRNKTLREKLKNRTISQPELLELLQSII